ncbi:glycosyltransferase family 87 protein [Sandaracinus amylolyticus]|uniref:glycosyltransferase family 87 protein n=1 Tax=Sandaracinus amylolyticus TaxID=927083 RepID=UPI001F294957|nr:hypothetical protein [Sandaracinus amylolyticus]UJR80516.1 Hypothetical protein I5071_25630 [Sandaracinus amylolyticus]
MTDPRKNARDEWIARAVVVVAAIATFARGVGGGLVPSWDDGRFLVENPDAQHVSWDALVRMWSAPRFEAYQPLHLLSYWIDVPWAGPSAPVVHAVSLALWCGALLLVLALMRKLGLSLVPAVIATLFFGLHPVQVEAVTWATGRKDVLAVALAAGSAIAHLGSERWNDRRAWISRALYVLAALTKTIVLPLPIVLFAADVVLRKRDARSAAIAQVPSFVIGAALAVVVVGLWRENEMIRTGSGSLSLVLATYAHHLGTALWPASVSPIYPLAREEAPSVAGTIIGCAAIVVTIVLAWRARAHELGRRVLFGMIAFVVLLAPVSNVLPLHFQWHDRYVVLPLLGIAFVLGACVDALRPNRVVVAIALALCAALALRTVAYENAWASDLALWQHAVSAQPRAFYAWLKLGEVRRDAGDHAGALRAYQEAIEIAPQLRLGHGAFMSALLLREEARREITPSHATETAQRFMMRMDDPVALRELAGEMAQMGYRDGVTYALARALDIEPIPDERLERAAQVQLAQGNEWLARFYLSRMGRNPVIPEVIRYVERERARERGEDETPPSPARAPTETEEATRP